MTDPRSTAEIAKDLRAMATAMASNGDRPIRLGLTVFAQLDEAAARLERPRFVAADVERVEHALVRAEMETGEDFEPGHWDREYWGSMARAALSAIGEVPDA